jgi:hypothetical protein
MKQLAAVPPANYGSAEWVEWRAPLIAIGVKRAAPGQTAEQWADEFLWRDADAADTRALGYCYGCGARGALKEVIRGIVYFCPCGAFRAHGDVKKMQRFLDKRRQQMSEERKAAVLALLPVAPADPQPIDAGEEKR